MYVLHLHNILYFLNLNLSSTCPDKSYSLYRILEYPFQGSNYLCDDPIDNKSYNFPKSITHASWKYYYIAYRCPNKIWMHITSIWGWGRHENKSLAPEQWSRHCIKALRYPFHGYDFMGFTP